MKRIRQIGEILVFALLLIGFVANAMTITGGYKEVSPHSLTNHNYSNHTDSKK